MHKFTTIFSSAACLALLASPAFAKNAPVLKIENFIGTIDITTGNHDKITITDADGAPVEKAQGRVTIDGGHTIKSVNCRSKKSSVKINLGGWKYKKRRGGYKDISEYPYVKITMPNTAHLIIKNSVIFGDVETIGSGDLAIRYCGDIDFGDIKGDLNLRISGSGDVKIGDAGAADLHVSGSGDLEAGDLASADIYVSGSGDLDIGDIQGHAKIRSSGAGDIQIDSLLGGLDYEGSGSSDFEARSVRGGNLHIHSSGSGDVSIADGDVKTLEINASGASDVSYRGRAVNAEAHASGAADITINTPSGYLEKSTSGAGEVRIRRH